ncbi:transposase [Candidatus Poribacteria bacterium]|nr:transposase [Candidatus Poribacteria bacterium]
MPTRDPVPDTGTTRARRRSMRLPEYDYAQAGAYHVTIVTYRRVCRFGDVADGEMRMNESGRIVDKAWDDLPSHYAHVVLGAFIVMPNHVHGIIVLMDDDRRVAVGAGLRPAPTSPSSLTRHGLPEIIRALKSFSARRINAARSTPGAPVWQRGYYERIIRDEDEMNDVRAYIEANPLRWADDPENIGM